MTSVYYLIVCVNLLYSFDRAEPHYTPPKTFKVHKNKLEHMLNSLNVNNQDVYLAKTVTPYYHMHYNQQLEHKQNRSRSIIDLIGARSHNLKNLMTYKLLPTVPSPVTKAYRNNDEFQIRYGINGNPKTVGCTIGKLSLGRTYCIFPTKIDIIKESHKIVAKVYEDFIRLSPLPASINPFDDGHWNTITVRSNEAGDVMACVTVKPKGYSNSTIQEQQQMLKKHFFKQLPNITLYHQLCQKRRCTHNVSPFILLYGKPYFLETLNGFKFEIRPDTVFPINKFGAEVMYNTIIRTAKLQPNTTVIDICSGTGINSIMVSNFVKEAIGFESVLQAVKEAKYCTELNNISNVRFLMSGIDRKINAYMKSIRASTNVVAILNHRRTGLGRNIITTLRKSSKISSLVYFFYKPNSPNTIQNLIDLCSDDYLKAPPFKMTKVIPFDMLPQTTYADLILVFQREPVRNISNVVRM